MTARELADAGVMPFLALAVVGLTGLLIDIAIGVWRWLRRRNPQ